MSPEPQGANPVRGPRRGRAHSGIVRKNDPSPAQPRGGDRDATHALHQVFVVRMSSCERTTKYSIPNQRRTTPVAQPTRIHHQRSSRPSQPVAVRHFPPRARPYPQRCPCRHLPAVVGRPETPNHELTAIGASRDGGFQRPSQHSRAVVKFLLRPLSNTKLTQTLDSYVNGHYVLPIGGRLMCPGWPVELPGDGQQICPLIASAGLAIVGLVSSVGLLLFRRGPG